MKYREQKVSIRLLESVYSGYPSPEGELLSHCAFGEFLWHALGESNPSFQVENLAS